MNGADIIVTINNNTYRVKDICREFGLGEQGYAMIKNHKDQIENIILSFTNKIYRNMFGNLISLQSIQSKPFKTCEELCKERGLDVEGFIKYRNTVSCPTLEEYINQYALIEANRKEREKYLILKEKCKKAGVSLEIARAYKSKHPDLTDEQIINICLSRKLKLKHKVTLREKCNKAGVNYNSVHNAMNIHRGITEEEAINYVQNMSVNLEEICRLQKLNHKYVAFYKSKHPELTREQIIKDCKKSTLEFKSRAEKLCRDNDYVFQLNTLLNYRNRRLELTDEQILTYYENKIREMKNK